MQWWFLVIYQLIFIELLVRTVRAGRIKRTVVGRYPVCPRGCTSCSHVNGCVTCESQYFMFLYRQNMRQIGICTPSCPIGYYGVRHQYYSKCNRCHIEHCEACFSRHYCTRCKSPYLAFQGQCVESCPEGLYYANYSKDCRETVDCMVGPWSPWVSCSRNGQMCGYKYGVQTRTRQILEYPSPSGTGCPLLTESRRCRMARRFCNGQCNRRKRHRKRKRKRKRKRGKARRRGRKNRNRTKKERKRGRRKDYKKLVRRRRLCRDNWRCFKHYKCSKKRTRG